MVTNINLSSEEAVKEKKFTGKPALFISVFILLAVIGVYFSFQYLKNRHIVRKEGMDSQIAGEEAKVKGTEYLDIIDFQERLTLLDQMIDDHFYWDSFLKKISHFMIPEVRVQKLSAKREAEGGIVEFSGVAASYDALSRELILLKSSPDIDSMEFRQASEGNIEQGGNQGGIAFDASLKINNSAFQK